MFKIIGKTFVFIVARISLFVLSAFAQYKIIIWCIELGWSLTYNIPVVNTLGQPMFLIIGLGLGVLFHKVIVEGLLLHTLAIVHVIASTVVALDMGLNKSVTLYSFKQMAGNFFSLSAVKHLVSTFIAQTNKIKKAILKNDIMPKFPEPKSKILRFFAKMCIGEIKVCLSFFDELVISYLWLTSMMHTRYSDKKKRPTIKDQAMFTLEAIEYIIRSFPVLLINNAGAGVMYYALYASILILVIVVIYSMFGFGIKLLVFVFLTHNLIKEIVYDGIIYSLRLCSMIGVFYKEVSKYKNSGLSSLVALIQKIPSLVPLAKTAKLSAFKEVKVDKKADITEHLIDLGDMENALKMTAVKTLNAFKITPEDVVDVDTSVPAVDPTMPSIEETGEANPIEAEDIGTVDVVIKPFTVDTPVHDDEEDELIEPSLPHVDGLSFGSDSRGEIDDIFKGE